MTDKSKFPYVIEHNHDAGFSTRTDVVFRIDTEEAAREVYERMKASNRFQGLRLIKIIAE